MLALFATTLTWTTVAAVVVVVVYVAPLSVFSAATTTSAATPPPDNGSAAELISAPAYYCNNNYQCQAIGYNKCDDHLCACDQNFYQVYNSTLGKTYCRLCSVFQESCAMTRCCQNSHATQCFNGMCVCMPGMNEECLGRYTPTLGIQLANTLSVSFAFVFLAITFVAVIRKTLFRCSFCRCDPMSRTASDSSLNEFVKQKMQNRPPCYEDIEKDLKVPIDNNQPPPEYSSKRSGRVDTFRGHAPDRTFSISDGVESNNSAPPNYSTFTTVTDVASTARTDNGEVILTRPIYMNGGGLGRT